MSEWISVADRLPEMAYELWCWESEWVLTYGAEGPQVARLRRHDDADAPAEEPEWVIRGPDGFLCEGVTHWLPITAPIGST
jgi:hypothetical protein